MQMNKRILYRYVIPAIMLAITSVIVLNLIKDTKLRGEMIQAVKHGSFQDIDDALAHGADINLKMEAGNTPLHSIAYKGDPQGRRP
jgi:ankyrin repeat protein